MQEIELWVAGNWQLHHNNAPAHSAHLIQTSLTKHGIPQVCQAPYCLDVAPRDFWLFPKMNNTLKGSLSESCMEIMENTTAQLCAIPKETLIPAIEGPLD